MRIDPVETLTDARSPAYTPGLRRPPNIKALTSVRFFAAIHVALFHMVRSNRWGPFAGFMHAGYVGVSFFFLLSGFILTYSHALEYEAHRGSPTKFWVARFARIYPVYLLSLMFALSINLSALFSKHAIAFVADLFLMQSWSTRLVVFFNFPAWSVSVEAFFYVVFPYMLMRLRPRSARAALTAVAGFWCLAMVPAVFALVRWPSTSWVVDSLGPGASTIFALRRIPLVALPEFLAGISLGWFYLKFRPSPRVSAALGWIGLISSITALLLADHLPFIMLHNGLLIPLFAMLLIGLGEKTWISRVLELPVLVLLGEGSFALYLFHMPILNAFPWLTQQRWLATSCAIGIVVPLSVALHLYVERPGRRVILEWWRRRHPEQLALTQQR